MQPTESVFWKACPTANSRLHLGDYAYVDGEALDWPNNLREGPGKKYSVLAKIEPGMTIQIIDGPGCVDGQVWWQVNVIETGITGWTAEGDQEIYWLAPCEQKDAFCGGALSTATAIRNGLVAYYPFNGNAQDESGGGHNGTVYGATLSVDRFERPQRAYFFDGLDDYIELPENLDLIDADFTVSAWIMPLDFGFLSSTSPACNRVIFAYRFNAHADPDTSNSGLVFELSEDLGCGGNNYIGLTYIGPDYAFRSIKTTYSPHNDWLLLTITRTGNELTMYINGERLLLATIPAGNILESPDFPFSSIGIFHRWEDTFFFPFSGAIDDVRLYNRALSGDEILALYNIER
jgi:hypothetical protein